MSDEQLDLIELHNWSDLPGKRIPRWPSGDVREIHIRIHSWVGISLGGVHWDVRVQEEQQQFWYSEENCWATVWDDRQSYMKLEAKVFNRRQARSIAKVMSDWIKKMNPKQRYKVKEVDGF